MKAEHVLYAKKEINYIKSFFILVYRMFILDDMLKIVHIRDMTLILKTVCGKFSHSMNYLQKQKLIKGSFIEEIMYLLLYDSLNYIS